MRLIPAPRGTGIVAAPVPKKLLTMAGIEDVYTQSVGATATLGNFGESTERRLCFFVTSILIVIWWKNCSGGEKLKIIEHATQNFFPTTWVG